MTTALRPGEVNVMNRLYLAGAALLFGAVVSPAAFCQSNELSILAGATYPGAQVSILSNISISGGVSAAVQVDFAHLLSESPAGNLYLELPVTRVLKASVGVNRYSVSAASSQVFFTPGIRYRFAPRSRISPYLVGGFGFGWFDAANVRVDSDVSVNVADGLKPAFGVGGGMQLRIGGPFAFRAEIRDFVAAGSNISNRNHVVYQGGFGLRF
jgi:opacity protein-like surface antigen